MIEKYLEFDCFKDLDAEMIKAEIDKNSFYHKIISKIWKYEEEVSIQNKNLSSPQEKLEEFVGYTREIPGKDSEAFRIWVWWAFGYHIVTFREKLSFIEDPEIKVKVVVLNIIYDFIEYSYKANEITKFFGLESIGPFTRNRQTSGWSKGGREKAEQNKEQVEEKQQRLRRLHQEMKERNPCTSNHGVDLRIAKQEGVKRSTVYNARKKPLNK